MKSLILISISPGGGFGEGAKLPENPLHPRWLRTDPANRQKRSARLWSEELGEFPKISEDLWGQTDWQNLFRFVRDNFTGCDAEAGSGA